MIYGARSGIMEDILNFRGLFPCCRGNIQRREDGKFMGDTTQIMLTMIAYMLVVIGIGGSATVDGGLGFVQALGAVCRDAQGRIIPPGAGGGALS